MQVGCHRRVALWFAIAALVGFAVLSYHSCFSSASSACYLMQKNEKLLLEGAAGGTSLHRLDHNISIAKDENLLFAGATERTALRRSDHNISIVMVINYSGDRLDFALAAVRAAANLHPEYWVDVLTTNQALKKIVQRLRPCRPGNVRLWLVQEDTRAQQLFESRYKHASVNRPELERFCIFRHIWVHDWMARAYSRRGLSVAIHLDADMLT
eukprot:4173613-Amphidinium_carterae.1